MKVVGAQIRAARGLLNISVSELAERTGLAINTVRKAESAEGLDTLTPANQRALIATLEASGVVFIEPETMGAGVRLASPDHVPRGVRRRGCAVD